MELLIDDDVKAVAEFMQQHVPAAKLASLASAVAELAPLLWGRYDREPVTALYLLPPPISRHDPHTQSYPGREQK